MHDVFKDQQGGQGSLMYLRTSKETRAAWYIYLRTSKEGSTGKPGMLQSKESQRVRLDLVSEQQQGAQFD